VARGGGDSGKGRPGVGPDQVGELGKKVGKRWAAEIWGGVEWSRGIPARKLRRRLGVGGHGEEERGSSRKEELGCFIGMQGLVEVKGRESSRAVRHRSTGGAGMLDGVSWRPLGIVCPTWNGEGRTAEAALAVGGMAGDAWARGAAQDCTTVACAATTARCAASAAGSTRAGGGRCGRVGRGQRGGGKRRGKGQSDTCMGAEGCGSGRGGAHGRAVAAACSRGETEEGEREVDEGDPNAISEKCINNF
jgi:hypothetical protein